MVYGPTADGSIRGCPSNVNPNCVSTGKASAKVFDHELRGGSIAYQRCMPNDVATCLHVAVIEISLQRA
jgi:hypothetical protein